MWYTRNTMGSCGVAADEQGAQARLSRFRRSSVDNDSEYSPSVSTSFSSIPPLPTLRKSQTGASRSSFSSTQYASYPGKCAAAQREKELLRVRATMAARFSETCTHHVSKFSIADTSYRTSDVNDPIASYCIVVMTFIGIVVVLSAIASTVICMSGNVQC
jgi:hypothetical protein